MNSCRRFLQCRIYMFPVPKFPRKSRVRCLIVQVAFARNLARNVKAPCIFQTEILYQKGREVYSIVRAKCALCRSNNSDKRRGNKGDERSAKKVGGVEAHAPRNPSNARIKPYARAHNHIPNNPNTAALHPGTNANKPFTYIPTRAQHDTGRCQDSSLL